MRNGGRAAAGRLKPYLKILSEEYQENGIPPMRPIFLHYENDSELYNLKYQYLFGRDLLVAPVYKPSQKTWRLYLPEDDWIDVWDAKEYKKGWIEIEAPIGKPPVFYRKDSNFAEIFNNLKNI